MCVWLNGKVVSEAEARIAPADRGFTLGDGVFETIRVSGGRPCRVDDHLHRLRRGMEVLRLDAPWDNDTLSSALTAVIAGQQVADGAARITVTRGPGARGLLPPADGHATVLVSAATVPPFALDVTAVIATITRRNALSPLSRIKSLNYLDNILARQEAADRGVQEALLLNTEGRVAEATSANLFAVLDGQAVTVPVDEGALPGIARKTALEALAIEERPITVQDLERAEEIVLTNSLSVRTVVSLDGRPVGNGTAGPLHRILAELHDRTSS